MADHDNTTLLTMDNSDEVENTFVDDNACDVKDQNCYEENSWPKEDPSGFKDVDEEGNSESD